MQEDLEQESMEPKIIRTQDENGEIHDFELVDILTVDEKEYGLLVHINPEGESEDEEEEEEVVIMRLSKQDDAYSFETIEDEEEFERVVSVLEADEDYELIDEEDEEEA